MISLSYIYKFENVSFIQTNTKKNEYDEYPI